MWYGLDNKNSMSPFDLVNIFKGRLNGFALFKKNKTSEAFNLILTVFFKIYFTIHY